LLNIVANPQRVVFITIRPPAYLGLGVIFTAWRE